ncbi:hypothetical protein HK104_005912 [Borealophlyctis nickersoniae]|nr:hypothetical protein HK104_005912 [Borealophlyctis nickersoniae]
MDYLGSAKKLLSRSGASTSRGGSTHTADSPKKTVLNSVAVGGTTSDIADDDIDRYVAELVAKEAAEANKKYERVGIAAYLEQARKNNLPRTNKRFLANVIKSTDAHNEALLRKEKEEAEDKLRGFVDERRKERYPDSRDGRRVGDADRPGRHSSKSRKRSRSRERGRRREEGARGSHMCRRSARKRHDGSAESRGSQERTAGESPGGLSKMELNQIKGGDGGANASRERPRREHSKGKSASPLGGRRSRASAGGNRDSGSESDGWDTTANVSSRNGSLSPGPSVLGAQSITGQPTSPSSAFTPAAQRQIRGRGGTGSSRLDKYFSKGYDPRLDFDNFDESNMTHYIDNLEDLYTGVLQPSDGTAGHTKSRKRKKESKKRKKKQSARTKHESDSDSSETSQRRSSSPSLPRSSSRERRSSKKRRLTSEDDEPRIGVSSSEVFASGLPRSGLPAACPW